MRCTSRTRQLETTCQIAGHEHKLSFEGYLVVKVRSLGSFTDSSNGNHCRRSSPTRLYMHHHKPSSRSHNTQEHTGAHQHNARHSYLLEHDYLKIQAIRNSRISSSIVQQQTPTKLPVSYNNNNNNRKETYPWKKCKACKRQSTKKSIVAKKTRRNDK